MSHRIKFTGENASGYVRYGNVTFPCGKSVTVPDNFDKDTLRRLSNHPEFEVSEAKASASAGNKD